MVIMTKACVIITLKSYAYIYFSIFHGNRPQKVSVYPTFSWWSMGIYERHNKDTKLET